MQHERRAAQPVSVTKMADVTMPRLSDSMEEGTILRWLKAEGAAVTQGDELVEIETDKATVTYEAESAGVLTIVAADGDTVALGGLIAQIVDEVTHGSGTPPSALAMTDPATAATATTPLGQTADERSRVRASPVARRAAERLGVDLATLTGSGVNGRVVKADVEASAIGVGAGAASVVANEVLPTETPTPVMDEITVHELSAIQQVIARRMAQSKATVPDFAVTIDVDMEAAIGARAEFGRLMRDGAHTPSYNDLVVKASALALRQHPQANGSYRDGRFELHARISIGIAVAAQGALLVPVVRDADRKGLAEIAAETTLLAQRVRDGEASPSDLSGGTFTVSNLGMFGVATFTAVVNPPQAGILAVGAIGARPVVRDGEIVIRNTMSLTLTSDHRILYGADAAEFLATLRSLLEQPLTMLL